jgi:hypothetical protein
MDVHVDAAATAALAEASSQVNKYTLRIRKHQLSKSPKKVREYAEKLKEAKALIVLLSDASRQKWSSVPTGLDDILEIEYNKTTAGELRHMAERFAAVLLSHQFAEKQVGPRGLEVNR